MPEREFTLTVKESELHAIVVSLFDRSIKCLGESIDPDNGEMARQMAAAERELVEGVRDRLSEPLRSLDNLVVLPAKEDEVL